MYPEHGIRKTYKEFDMETDELAKAFIGMGVQKENILPFGQTIKGMAIKPICNWKNGSSFSNG